MSDYVRISSNNQYFVFKARENGKLMVSNSDGQVVFIIDEPVTEFSLSSDARYLAYLVPQGNVVTTTSSGTAYDEIITMSRSGEASLNVLDLKTGEKKLVVTAVDIDGNLIWSPNTEYIRLCNL